MRCNSPSVSIITIVKNNEELLPKAIDSVLSQSYTDFEHIIVNDGSTDKTAEIIDNYAKSASCIVPEHLAENVGRASARNAGLDIAGGKYLFFLDSDDYLPKTALQDLFDVAEREKADVVFGKIQPFDLSTGQVIPHHYTDSILEPERHGIRFENNPKLVHNHSIIGRLYRKDVIKNNNIAFSTTRKNGEDVLFAFYTTFYAQRISTLPNTIVYHYNTGNYLSTANEAKLFDARDNVLETLEFSLKNCNANLQNSMHRKAVIFAANLERAQRVYEGKSSTFINYLESLPPLIDRIPQEVLEELPPYYRTFANCILNRNFDEAFLAWIQKNSEKWQNNKPANQRILELQNSNRQLAHHLEELYSSTSWRITAPLRWLNRLLHKQ